MRKAWSFVVASLVALLVAVSCASAPAPEGTIKVGWAMPYSGSSAGWGTSGLHGAQLAAEQINQAGGITVAGQKYKFEIIPYDNKMAPADTLTAVNRLLYDDGVKFMSIMGTGAVAAAQQLTEKEKALVWTPAQSPALVGPNHAFTFFQQHVYAQLFPLQFQYFKQTYPNAKTVALINTNNDGGKTTEAQAVKAAKEVGLEIVTDMFYEPGDTQAAPLATKLIANKPDIVELASTEPALGPLMLKELYGLGYKGPKGHATAVAVETLTVPTAGKDAAEGLVVAMESRFTGPTATEAMQNFQKKFQEKGWGEPDYFAGMGSNGVNAMAAGIKAANSLDTTKVAEALRSGLKFETVYGQATYGGKDIVGNNSMLLYPVIIHQVKNGKAEPVLRLVPPELK